MAILAVGGLVRSSAVAAGFFPVMFLCRRRGRCLFTVLVTPKIGPLAVFHLVLRINLEPANRFAFACVTESTP